jgi:hypothetical protein
MGMEGFFARSGRYNVTPGGLHVGAGSDTYPGLYLMGGMLEVVAQPGGTPRHVGGRVGYMRSSASPYGLSTSSTTTPEERTRDYACAVNRKPRPPNLLRPRRLVSDREGPRLLL